MNEPTLPMLNPVWPRESAVQTKKRIRQTADTLFVHMLLFLPDHMLQDHRIRRVDTHHGAQ